MKIGLFIKEKVLDEELTSLIQDKIAKSGHVLDNDNPEVVLSLGGDGTFLKAVHKYLPILGKVTFVCVNKGHLGYFSDFKVDDIDNVLNNFDSYKVNRYRLLSAKINDEVIYAVNEIRIENPFHTLKSEVYVNDTYLESFRGNGLVVSTSMGSTAYNRSLKGAIVDPKLETLQLNEIASIHNRLYSSLGSPLVLSSDSVITFKGDFSKVVIGYDYLVESDYKSNQIQFQLSDKKVAILNKKEHNYIDKLNKTFVERE